MISGAKCLIHLLFCSTLTVRAKLALRKLCLKVFVEQFDHVLLLILVHSQTIDAVFDHRIEFRIGFGCSIDCDPLALGLK